jgi:hypothetical protein
VLKAMMRLNWWQRIGIVLSIAWFIVGSIWINSLVIDELGGPSTIRFRQCVDARSSQPDATKPKDTDWALCSDRGRTAANAPAATSGPRSLGFKARPTAQAKAIVRRFRYRPFIASRARARVKRRPILAGQM